MKIVLRSLGPGRFNHITPKAPYSYLSLVNLGKGKKFTAGLEHSAGARNR